MNKYDTVKPRGIQNSTGKFQFYMLEFRRNNL